MTRDRLINIMIFLSTIVISASLIGGGVALYDRFQLTNERRAQQHRLNVRLAQNVRQNREALRAILCLAYTQVVSDKTIPAERRRRALAFYVKALKLIQVRPCVTSHPRR